ncbi:sodium/hydrogen exchanger [Cystobacter fuscus DSM 2262]|uniref:Sodium/hydrogen exchanger n=1 Tax=Cystobacter fuscus (strain ATCC 25194 / DSM 2262 / NBRC 100088 / M29) TaxID=1242864 RepID=S9QDB6_CYSF2|nr:cation:proton antiporter [Cystobacter fuscus]EPX59344.1 sodium/hydrogen exchanger [Cystobacter fuscus DSM 2262]
MANLWFVVIGVLLIFMALSGALLKRLPLSSSLVYLAVGYALGCLGAAYLAPSTHMHVLERLTEVAVIVSLFGAGLKLRLPLRDSNWRLPLRLALGAMVLTVGLLALGGVALGLPPGAAILLGAMLAPTDPVLASDVQVTHPLDTDRLRFGLTGEAGFNDGIAFPFVMLGLGLLGLHDLGTGGWRWVVVDVLWAVTGGLVIGWVLGGAVGRLVVFLRRAHKEAVGLDDFLALGLISLAYGVSLWAHAYGFLAVFAAGLSLRRMEARSTAVRAPTDVVAMAAVGQAEEVVIRPETASACMAQAVLGFTEQLERMGEVALMVLVGMMLATLGFEWEGFLLALLLLFVVRPASVALLTVGTHSSPEQRVLIAWFGIRGIGSLYYLFYALTHGLEPALGERLTHFVLVAVAMSAVLHGVSATPLMTWYSRRRPPGASAG